MAQVELKVKYGPENSAVSTPTQPASLAFVGADVSPEVDPEDYPIVVSLNTAYSYERYLFIELVDNSNILSIKNIRVWRSQILDNSGQPVPGANIYFGNTRVYASPTADKSTIATIPIPVSDPGSSSPNVTIGGSYAGELTNAGDTSDFIVCQLELNPSVMKGGTFTINFAWVEVL